MRQIYAKAEQDIITEITRKRAMEYVDYAEVASLERVQAILTDMQEKAGDYIPQYIEKIFYSATEKDASGYKNARVLTSTQTNIEQQLVNNLMGSLMEASAVAFETAKRELTIGRLVEGEIREAQLTSILNQKAAGLSWRTASKNMKIDLQQKGITSFVDKAGREWSLTDYCDMCSRTVARQAEVAAALTADDWDLWQISSIGSTCKLCATYEGRVYSKSGLNPDYPPLSAAFGKIDVSGGNDLANTYLNIHPNCLHSLMKYTTMGKTEEQIQRDKDFSSFEKRPAKEDYRSRKQRDAYRQKEANRAKLLSDRNQWQRYQTALGKDVPGFEAFRKNKINNTPKYQEWESKYKSLRSKQMAIPYSSDKPFEKLERVILNSEQKQSIIDFARDNGIKVHNARKFFGNPNLLKEQITALKSIKDDLGYKGDISIGFINSVNDVYGQTTKNGSILFNSYALIDRDLTVLSMIAQDGAFTLSAKDMIGISAHEMGHLIQKLKIRDNTIEIARKAYYNIGEELSGITLNERLADDISTYAFAHTDKFGDPSELLPEILSKHYTNPDRFTNEFVKLLREEMTRW